MRRVAVRLPDELWSSLRSFSKTLGTSTTSEALRVLVERGLVSDRDHEAGYRAGLREGRLAGYGEIMRRLGQGGLR